MKVTREMEDARARLEAYADKIRPYPALEVTDPLVIEQPVKPSDRIEQLEREQRWARSKLLSIDKKLEETLSKKRERYKEYD